MWRWKFDPRLSSPPAQVPTHCPGGASREGSAPAWEGKEQGVQCSVRLQPGVWIRAGEKRLKWWMQVPHRRTLAKNEVRKEATAGGGEGPLRVYSEQGHRAGYQVERKRRRGWWRGWGVLEGERPFGCGRDCDRGHCCGSFVLDKEEKGDTALPKVKVVPLLALRGDKLNATLRQRHGCGRPLRTRLARSLCTEVRA